MSNDRIKVVGYAQKTFYNDQIEYRNFSPDLVGLQLASNGGTPLFTMGTFAVTTNLEPKLSKVFATRTFSNFVTLTDLDLTLQEAESLLRNNAGVILNLDKTNLTNYALFGPLTEAIRVSLENIITNWPAALYINPEYSLAPLYVPQTSKTFEDYTYNSLTNTSSFKIYTNVITNRFGINYKTSGSLLNTFNSQNSLRDLVTSYLSYSVLYNGNEYDILGFTGSTDDYNDYIYLQVKGDVFSNTPNDFVVYHIKPNSTKENLFYNSLPDLEYYLLNRLTTPKFTSTFNYSIKSDSGELLYVNDSLTWPTTDGYNIDFDTDYYEDYATKLLDISTNFDLSISNLIVRFLVTESITNFDTTATRLDPLDEDTSGQKVNKTLTIYGVQFDKINTYINGIRFANVVTYNKLDNTPDIYLKNLSRVLGWELISSVLENNLLKNYIQPSQSTYSGQSVGLTAIEADIELWRRIILNTPWLWKSKGTRKSVEFLFKFIGTPLGLIKFNEYIYLAENKVDIDMFQSVLELNGLSTDISTYPIGSDGYPLPKPDTPEMYFQNKGLWYRQTGGPESNIDITSGNNPHVGPYDGGYQYVNQFRELIPNFSAVTITSSTSSIVTKNIFTNYNLGSFTKYSGTTYVDITTEDGVDFSNCFVVSATTIEDPKQRQDQTDCGCDIPENLRSLSICIQKNNEVLFDCQNEIADFVLTPPYNYYTYDLFQYLPDGSQYTVNGNPVYNTTQFVNLECCNRSGKTPFYYEDYAGNGTDVAPFVLQNVGYICCNSEQNRCGCYTTCKWKLSTPRWRTFDGNDYLQFEKPDGTKVLTSQDGCNCISEYTTRVFLSASSTDVGYACQLTQTGKNDVDSPNSVIYQTYQKRSLGDIGCTDVYNPPITPKIFAVILNNETQVGGVLNDIQLIDLQNQQANHNFMNSSVPLSGGTTLPIAGYYNSYNPSTLASPQNDDNLMIRIQKTLSQFSNIEFNPNVGHRISYLITDIEYTTTTIVDTGYRRANRLRTVYNSTNDSFESTFVYNPTRQPINLYLIIDVSPQQTLNTVCYTFQNTTNLIGIYRYIDVNGNPQSGVLNPQTSVSKCAVRNSQSGTNVIITGGITPCTNDGSCSVFEPPSNGNLQWVILPASTTFFTLGSLSISRVGEGVILNNRENLTFVNAEGNITNSSNPSNTYTATINWGGAGPKRVGLRICGPNGVAYEFIQDVVGAGVHTTPPFDVRDGEVWRIVVGFGLDNVENLPQCVIGTVGE